MKNALLVILLALTIVFGYVVVITKVRLIPGEKGETATIQRGDLTLPIAATGEVLPARRISIKPEASGAVLQILKQGGQRVHRDELIIRLEQDEEQRSVDRAEQDLQIAEARWEEAQITLSLAEGPDLDFAKAQVDQLQPGVEHAVYRKHKVEELDPHQRNQDELIERDTTYRSLLAQRDAALASYAKAKLLIPRLKQTVLQMEATKRTAEANLADAKRRLGKTDIASPIDGILAVVRTHVGEIVQGGKTTFTGGSELAVILDVSKILVRAEVDESEIARVRAISPEWAQPGNEDVALTLEGLIAASREMEHLPRITVEAFRDEEFAGVIERIYPEPQVINNVTTFQIDVVVTSPNREQLLPRMRAEVEFTSEHVSDVLLCPNEAIREGPNGKLGVYVPPKQSTDPEADPVFQPCVFGLNNGMFSEVREGIAEGATVYSKLPRRFGRKD